MWLFETYGRDSALYEAVNMGWICDAKTLDYLIDVLGARASRYCQPHLNFALED